MNLNCNFRKGFHEDIKEVPVAPAHHSELKEQKIPISSLFKDDAPWGPWPLGQCRRVQNSRYTHTLILDWYFVMVEQFTTNLGIRKNKMKKKKRNARDPKWLLFVFQQPPPLIFPWYWQRKLAICIYKKEDKPLNITTKHIYFWFTSLYYTNDENYPPHCRGLSYHGRNNPTSSFFDLISCAFGCWLETIADRILARQFLLWCHRNLSC